MIFPPAEKNGLRAMVRPNHSGRQIQYRPRNGRIRCAVVLVLLQFTVAFAHAQGLSTRYMHTGWARRDGFGLFPVQALAQTNDGYLWIGTPTGLWRFDGTQFVEWREAADGVRLPSQDIRFLLAAEGNSLWIGTAAGIDKLACVPGRFERVDCGQPFTVVVDYAHTDDALRNLTALGRELVSGAGAKGRVLTVFGCGGDRDRKKRPLMGEAAGRGSDFVVLTSDNPRSEDPLAIINDAVVGVQKTGVKYRVEPDRREAIALAIGEARPGDIVLLAGKGHEKVQVTREGAAPFDDLEVARDGLRAAGFECEAAGAKR